MDVTNQTVGIDSSSLYVIENREIDGVKRDYNCGIVKQILMWLSFVLCVIIAWFNTIIADKVLNLFTRRYTTSNNHFPLQYIKQVAFDLFGC